MAKSSDLRFASTPLGAMFSEPGAGPGARRSTGEQHSVDLSHDSRSRLAKRLLHDIHVIDWVTPYFCHQASAAASAWGMRVLSCGSSGMLLPRSVTSTSRSRSM